jgi:glycerophosphoryl diester phosphodiesterase
VASGVTTSPRLIAYRGASAQAPEHTIPAYEAAVAAGADALQLAVHLSADDQLVVIHDATLERTTDGRGAVRGHTLRALKRLDAGGWFGARFRGQRLQTLSEVLERFRARTRFGIELRPGADGYPGIEERLVGLLQVYDVTEAALVVSADPGALARCHALDNELRLGRLAPPDALVGVPRLDPAAIEPRGRLAALVLPVELAGPADVEACGAAGLECQVGVIDDPEDARRMAGWGVAGLITTRPDRVRPALGPG